VALDLHPRRVRIEEFWLFVLKLPAARAAKSSHRKEK
jgi:hypothetical protein